MVAHAELYGNGSRLCDIIAAQFKLGRNSKGVHMAKKNEDSETNSWLRTLYEITHSDTRWAKEQGWQVVNWTLLLFGAVLGIQQIVPALPLYAFLVADTAIVLVASFYLLDLHWWTSGMRRTADRIENEIPNASTLLERRAHDRNHYKYLVVQFLVVGGGLIFVVMAHLYSCPKGGAA